MPKVIMNPRALRVRPTRRRHRRPVRRSRRTLTLATLLVAQCVFQLPVEAQRAGPSTPGTPRVAVNRTVPRVTPPAGTLSFSAAPSAAEIFAARVFAEPLVLVGGEASAAENIALASALQQFHDAGDPGATASFDAFLRAHPASPWRASLLVNVGKLYVETGAFSRALDAFDEAFRLAESATDRYGKAVADLAVAEWLTLAAMFGQSGMVEQRVERLGARSLNGAAASRARAARETIALIQQKPEWIIASGPEALKAILRQGGRADVETLKPFATHVPTLAGTSLAEVAAMARAVGLSLVPAYRETAETLPVPAVIHWKLGHYSALLEQDGERYRIEDPALGGSRWMTRSTLLEEISGYALLPEGSTAGWAPVPEVQAGAVIGHSCPPGGPGSTGPPPQEPPPCNGMAVYDFHPVLASLRLSDIPVGYQPARGPSAEFRLTYNQREGFTPQIPTFSHVGPRWTFNWLSYVKEEPQVCGDSCQPAHVWVYLPGGWRDTFSLPDAQGVYPVNKRTGSVLVRTSTSPLAFERRLSDGSIEIFGLSDGAAANQRRVFLTERRDPRGAAMTFTYDAQFRLVAAVDALGQVSTLDYEDATDPLKITKVTDPFGRSATLTYNAAGQLASITDVLGLTSSLAYGPEDFVALLTTPYGTTTFRHEAVHGDFFNRYIEATDPAGATERLAYAYETPGLASTEPSAEVPSGFAAWNANLERYNTLHWDKRAWLTDPGSLATATITHWLYEAGVPGQTAYAIPVPHSVKPPLERRVWYAYPGQEANTSSAAYAGSLWQPSRIARTREDNTSQVTERTYNALGHLLSHTDAMGRRTAFTYAANDIDLLEVRNTTGTRNDRLAAFDDYTSGHVPEVITDAAGEVTQITYNTFGQPLTVTNATNETTTVTYDATTGAVATITGPVTGATTTLTYDGYGRVASVTSSDGYTVATTYDVFDRPIRHTYPDGTYEEVSYDRLDVTQIRDRLRRITRRVYDASRRLTGERDPLGRTVSLDWCACGSLGALTDGKGQTTRWTRDVLGRVTSEVRADGATTTSYAYDVLGRLTTVTDPLAQVTTYSYALDDALTLVAHSNVAVATGSLSYTYDPDYARLASMTDSVGTTTFTYHPVGSAGALQTATIDGPLADDTVSYAYDALGRATSRLLDGTGSTFTFDALGRVASLAHAIGTFTYAYDGTTSRLSTLTYPNGQTSTYDYFGDTGDHRLQTIHHATSSSATLSKFDYTYDVVGNILTWRQERTGQAPYVYDFGYDAADQLVAAVKKSTDPTPTILTRQAWAYDAAGNRTVEQEGDAVLSATHDALNRLGTRAPGGALVFAGTVNEPATVTIAGRPALVDSTNTFRGVAPVAPGTSVVTVAATDASGNTAMQDFEIDVTGATTTYSYDANGNLTSDGTRTFTWNARNELVRVQQGGVDVATFVYDALGRRVQKVAGGVTRLYLYDDEDIVEERAGTDVIRYVHGPGIDDVLARTTNGTDVTYYLADHLGSIVQETNASAQVTLTREYDPWGKLLQANGTGFAFTGREWDSETGHFYHRARYYDPVTARFLGPDPSGFVDGPNLYRYVGNQPLRYRDPSGRNAIAGAIVGGSVAGPVGAVIGGVAGAGLGAVVGQWLWNNVVEPVFSQNERERRNPLKGEPGSESQTDNQTRRYGPDGYPESDFDAGHRTHNKEPHVHDWNRPKDGTPPTNRNRGPARDPMPGDPPPPRNATGCNLK